MLLNAMCSAKIACIVQKIIKEQFLKIAKITVERDDGTINRIHIYH